MTSLTARFREVELTFNVERPLPSPLPSTWLQLKSAGAVVRFVETHFEQAQTEAEILRVLGPSKDASFRPMTLRAIFLAMARKSGEA